MLKLRGTGTSEIPALDLTTPLAVVDGGTGVTVSRQLAQIVTYQTGTYATGSTAIPNDNTIPQITEGDQYMSLSITPTNVNSILEIDVTIQLVAVAAGQLIAALFRDATSDAMAVANMYNNGNEPKNIKFTHYVTAGSLSATTFRVRGGSSAATTTYFNGNAGAQQFGGVYASRITIKEYLP